MIPIPVTASLDIVPVPTTPFFSGQYLLPVVAARTVHSHRGAPLTTIWSVMHHEDGVVQTAQLLEVVAEVLIRRDDDEGSILRTQHLKKEKERRLTSQKNCCGKTILTTCTSWEILWPNFLSASSLFSDTHTCTQGDTQTR